MSILAIREFHQLCLKDGDEAIQKRYEVILKFQKLVQVELESTKNRLNFLSQKAHHEGLTLNHTLKDTKKS